ncbi:MAG: cell division protein FtsX [Beijerinckiaceae bacterium]
MTESQPSENDAPPPGAWQSVVARLFPGRRLIPAESIAGRALVAVIAIMTFLAALTAGAAVLIHGASRDWSSLVAREMTIQIKPALGRDLEKDAARAAEIARVQKGVAEVRVFSEKESAQLLEPWLGPDLNLKELPVPRLITIRRSDESVLDIGALKAKLAEATPNAILDDHRLWIERLTVMARSLFFAALAILLLVLASMTFAVSFATRGAMAGNKEIIDVLHFVGAEDRYIAREFQRHFLVLGLQGGLAGGVAAILTFLVAGRVMSGWIASPGGEQVASLFGAFALGWPGYFAIAAISFGMALLTAAASRMAVARRLAGLA